ncbi:hypothetical protein D1872_233720 [compost metagenome]|jgi:hypothetical protein
MRTIKPLQLNVAFGPYMFMHIFVKKLAMYKKGHYGEGKVGHRKDREGSSMNKQEILIQALQRLENFTPENSNIKNSLHDIKQKVQSFSEKEFEQEMSMVVTIPAEKVPYPAHDVRAALDEVFPELEQAFQGTKESEIISAMNRIRGILGTDDNLHYPS